MLENIPSDMPILILGSYRSGSTALGDYLAKELNYQYFGEPYHWNEDVKAKCSDFFEYKKDNSNYVWKLFTDHIPITEPEKTECLQAWSNSYVIKLCRKDIAKQITSWIISMKTDVWNSTSTVQIPTVDIKDEFIEYCVQKELVNLDALEFITEESYHVQMYYEDIQNILFQSDFKTTLKPENYEQVLQKVKSILTKQGRL